MDLEEARKVCEGTKVVFDAEVWDFGYVTTSGTCLIYTPETHSMASAVEVAPELLDLERVARERVARFTEKHPVLPPKWEWHPSNGREDAMIRWRALGPLLSGRRVVAHARDRTDDNPAGCAEVAWELWEHLSGLERGEMQHLRRIEAQLVQSVGNGRVRCALCRSIHDRPRSEKTRGPWHSRHCSLWDEE